MTQSGVLSLNNFQNMSIFIFGLDLHCMFLANSLIGEVKKRNRVSKSSTRAEYHVIYHQLALKSHGFMDYFLD